MHPSSVENMVAARDRFLSIGRDSRVLEVGGGRHNYSELFDCADYAVADIQAGAGVTHVMPDPYELPFADDHFDCVLSGQMLEHCLNPFRSVAEMRRVLRPGGRMVLIAPSAGPRHFTVDCWRFMDDAFSAIAAEVGLLTVADWITADASDERSARWRDHVFVGEKP